MSSVKVSMRKNLNIIKNMTYNGLGFLISILFYLLATPIFVSVLSVDTYGSYVVIMSFISFMSFADFGLGQSIVRFFPYYVSKGEIYKAKFLVYFSIYLTLVIGFLMLIVIFSFTDYIVSMLSLDLDRTEGIVSVRLASLIVFVIMVSNIFSGILRAIERFDLVNLVFVLQVIFSNTIVIFYLIFYSGTKKISTIFFMTLVVYTIFMALNIYLGTKFLIKVSRNFSRYNDHNKPDKYSMYSLDYKGMLKFNLFYILNVISGNVVMRLDKIIVAYFLGSLAVSVYSIVYNLASGISALIGSITYVYMPRFSNLLGTGDKSSLKNIFFKAFEYISLVSFLLIMIYMLFIDSFINLWIDSSNLTFPKELVLLMGYVFFFSCVSSVSLWYFMAINKTHINLISSLIGSSLFLVSSFFLIPSFGLKGVGIAYLSVCIPATIYNYYAFKTLGFKVVDYLRVLIPYVVSISTYVILCLVLKGEFGYLENMFGLTLILIVIFHKRSILSDLKNIFGYRFNNSKGV